MLDLKVAGNLCWASDFLGPVSCKCVASNPEFLRHCSPQPQRYTGSDGKFAKGKQVIAELTTNRKEVRSTRSYELRFEGLPREVTFWMKEDRLVDAGWAKMIREVDEKIIAREAMYKRPLTTRIVRTGCCLHLLPPPG